MSIQKKKMKEKCRHEYISTMKKGRWEVMALPLNNRGEPHSEIVVTTVFECLYCRDKREYPDTWEKNYVVPDGYETGDGNSKKKVAKV